MKPLLSLSHIRAGYGDSVVLEELSLDIGEGEIVCLLGANGAGKTTTTRVIAGLLEPSSGDFLFDGTSIRNVPAFCRVDLGICLSPEGRQVFPDLTVVENLLLGSHSLRARPYRKQTLDEVFALFPTLMERKQQKAGVMSGGEQQMLAIGRALMGRPRLLMLDEPSLGLAPKIVVDVYAAIAETAQSGISILIVEQNAEAALSAAHRGYVLANGRIAAAGTAAELRGSSLVQEAFLGKTPTRRNSTGSDASAPCRRQAPHRSADTGVPVLEVRNVSKSFGGLKAIDDLSLAVKPGQCFGIIGANGAGKTTLLNLVTGYLKPGAGTIHFQGKPVTGLPPYKLARLGMGRTSQIVQPFAEMTVLENVMTGALFSRHGRQRSFAQSRALCEGPLETVGLVTQANTPAGALNLGGKKKLELARVLVTEPKLMLLDEVMGGLTTAEVKDILAVLERIKASAVTIVMVEHLVHVITHLCDYVLVLHFGRELFHGTPEDVVEHPEVIRAYLGKPAETA